MKQVNKILIVRFSSIGDIVLTTPVVRCLYKQLPETEIHFVTREKFRPVIAHNPCIHKLYTFKEDISELFEQLKAENYDVLIDLHKNLRSRRLRQHLKTKTYTFDKINAEKFLAVNFKMLKQLPSLHIVDRYFQAVAPLGVTKDGHGLDYFIAEAERVKLNSLFTEVPQRFVSLVLGGSYYTKQIPYSKLTEICSLLTLPVVLIGAAEDSATAEQLRAQFPGLINTCGKLSINQSASVIQQSEWVITSDTGMMHIAAAYGKKIISLWGNTLPEFGMGPYAPQAENRILEVKGLECRPCSKLGYQACPLGHFKCMNGIDVSIVVDLK